MTTDAAAIEAFCGGLVSYQGRIVDVLAATGRPDTAPLVHILSGMLHMLAEADGAQAQARPFLDAARTGPALSARDALWLAALDHWVAGDGDATIAAFADLHAADPADLTALKLLQYHLFNRGEFAAMLRAALASQAVAPDAPYLGGMLAFAFEQMHLLDEAEAAARAGLAVVPDDPWAQHALAHVWLTRGQIDTGLAALTQWSPGWVGLNSFMVTHLWWHLALFHLSKGDVARALAIHDEHVWAHDRTYSQDQISAVSLLARIEAAGGDVGNRWAELGPWLAPRAQDTTLPFLAVQYLYGLARAGRAEAQTLLDAIAARAAQGDRVWADAALPLARGLFALGHGDAAGAVPALAEAVPRLAHLGGSHAQRDLFALLLVEAQLAAGLWAEAQQALEIRRGFDPLGVPVNAALARVYDALALPDQAQAARARIAA